MATLQELLESAMESNGETSEDLEMIVVGGSYRVGPDEPMEVEYDELANWDGNTGYGGQELPTIRAWSEEYVYIKGTYDGSEWVTSVPRNPNMENPGAIGGG